MAKKSNKEANPTQDLSKVSWVLVGVRPAGDEALAEDVISRMLTEAFEEKRAYKLFLCGVEVDKQGTLTEMEDGYLLLKSQLKEYKDGDYCIISTHVEGSLLFLPTELEENAKNIIGDTDHM